MELKYYTNIADILLGYNEFRATGSNGAVKGIYK